MDPYLYFAVEKKSGIVKVGISRNPPQRLRQLGPNLELWLAVQMPDAPEIERRIHYMFRAHRLMGEWFSPDPELLALGRRIFSESDAVMFTRHRKLRQVSRTPGSRTQTWRRHIVRPPKPDTLCAAA